MEVIKVISTTINYYKECRELAGFTQETAAEKLNISVRALSGYENGTKVQDDIVDAMSTEYNAPLLAIWHLKENSVLGKWLPDFQPTRTQNDMGFNTVLASVDVANAEIYIKKILADGFITVEEMNDIDIYENHIKSATGKLLSVEAYLKMIKNGLMPSVKKEALNK